MFNIPINKRFYILEKRGEIAMRNLLKTFKIFMVALIIIAGVASNTTVAFAATKCDDSTINAIVEKYGPNGTENTGNKNFSGSLASYFSTTATERDYYVQVEETKYYFSNSSKNAIIEEGKNLDNKAALIKKDAENIKDFKDATGNLQIKADVGTASGALIGFSGVINTFLGIIVVVTSMGILLQTGLDICYIVFPEVQNKCEESRQSGGAFAGKTTSGGETKMKWVSDEALYSIKTANTLESGKNPLLIYAKKRVAMIIILAVVNFLFLTGRMTILTDIALSLADGILDILQSI